MTQDPHGQSRHSDGTRRAFLGATTGLTLNFAVVPRHVLGGKGSIAPSERINVAVDRAPAEWGAETSPP